MKQLVVKFAVFFSCLHFLDAATDTTYTAAVVEYYPIRNFSLSVDDRLNGNVAQYIQILSEINELDLDVVVFPEATITTGASGTATDFYVQLATEVPDGAAKISPCSAQNTNFPDFFKNLSCAANTYNTYLVVNLIEKAVCNSDTQEQAGDDRPCASYGYNLYNTDVAFDRNGTVVSRYRKFNLFGEYELNRTVTPDVSTFTTDFNVTFGMFTCFDILFETPSLALTRMGVRNIIFPTMWFSELPFLTGLQVQEMFARATDVNLLAAGANNPTRGSGGTGIFQGRNGPVIDGIVEKGGSKVFLATIGKTPELTAFSKATADGDTDQEAKDMDGFRLIRDHVDAYTTIPLNLSLNTITEELCHEAASGEKLCCFFDLTITTDGTESPGNVYNYRLAAFTGVRSYSGVYNGGTELCGVVACTNGSQESCGERFQNYSTVAWPTTFEAIKIRANFSDDHTKMQYPNSLLSSMRSVVTNATVWSSEGFEEEELVERTFVLREPQNRLLTFAIYGRDFGRDFDPFASGARSVFSGFTAVMLVLVVVLTFISV